MRFQWQVSRGCGGSAPDLVLAQRQLMVDANISISMLASVDQQQQQQQLGSKNYLGVKSSLLHHSETPYENDGKVPLSKVEI